MILQVLKFGSGLWILPIWKIKKTFSIDTDFPPSKPWRAFPWHWLQCTPPLRSMRNLGMFMHAYRSVWFLPLDLLAYMPNNLSWKNGFHYLRTCQRSFGLWHRLTTTLWFKCIWHIWHSGLRTTEPWFLSTKGIIWLPKTDVFTGMVILLCFMSYICTWYGFPTKHMSNWNAHVWQAAFHALRQ